MNPVRINAAVTGTVLLYNSTTDEIAGNSSVLSVNSTPQLVMYNNVFRYVPWTAYAYDSTFATDNNSFATVVIGSILNPTPTTNSKWHTAYSVIGNTMYMKYAYSFVSDISGTSGTGFYLYKLPPNYTIDTSVLRMANINSTTNSSTFSSTFGSQIGTCIHHNSSAYSIGQCVSTSHNSNGYICLRTDVANGAGTLYSGFQSATYFNYGGGFLDDMSFEASFPILP